ncbi:hypothetical protein HDU81_007208 [Chytriomyces hyalinus]|nr:hypothetical protein HDU81_007208 [Chytriomyces hyalinus]
MGKQDDDESTGSVSKAVSHGLRTRQKMNYSIPPLSQFDDEMDVVPAGNPALAQGHSHSHSHGGAAVTADVDLSPSQRANGDADPADAADQLDQGDDEDDEDVTRCVCDQSDENFGDMIQCDQCLVWQHNGCVGIRKIPKNYYCEQCKPTNHPYFKLLGKTSSNSSAPKASVTPAKRRNTMNSMDAADTYLPPSSAATEGARESTSLESTPANPPQPSRPAKAAGKKRSRESLMDHDFGETESSIPEKPEKKSKAAASADSTETVDPSVIKPTKPATSKSSKARSTKKSQAASCSNDLQDSKPVIVMNPRNSVQSTTDKTGGMPAGSSVESATIEFPLADVKAEEQTPPLTACISDVAIPKSSVLPAVEPKRPKQTSLKTRALAQSRQPPSPTIPTCNANSFRSTEQPSQEFAPYLKPRPVHHRCALSEIKRRVASISEFLRSIKESSHVPLPADADAIAHELKLSACTCEDTRKPSISSDAMSLTCSDNAVTDCSMLTPPLSTTSPSPVFTSLQKQNPPDILELASSASLSQLGKMETPAVTASSLPPLPLQPASIDVCCITCGLLKDGGESSYTILNRLQKRLDDFYIGCF